MSDTDTTPKRMTLTRVVEMLLERGSHGASSVTLSRNAKGETQIEVVVRTSDDGPVRTPEDAQAVAIDVFETLRTRYPMAWGTVGAKPETTSADAS